MKLGWWSPGKLLAGQPQDVSLLYLGGCRAWPCSCQHLRGPERHLCSLPAPRSSSEQHSTTNNFQEQFTNGGETKTKSLNPIFDQTLSGLPQESSMGLILRGKWLWKLQRSGCFNCTSNIIWCCTHTAPRANLQGFLYTHNLNTRDIQQDSLLQLSKSLEITTFPTYLKKHWKHDMTKSWLILRLQFSLMAFSP